MLVKRLVIRPAYFSVTLLKRTKVSSEELLILHSINFSKEELKWSLFDHKVQLTQLDLCTGNPRCDSSGAAERTEILQKFGNDTTSTLRRCSSTMHKCIHFIGRAPRVFGPNLGHASGPLLYIKSE